MNSESNSKKCNIGEMLLDKDKFGQSYALHLEEGKAKLPSKMGTFCSFLLLMIMIAYTGYKVSILEGKKSVEVLQVLEKDHFDDNDSFGANQGLNVAIAVVNPFD